MRGMLSPSMARAGLSFCSQLLPYVMAQLFGMKRNLHASTAFDTDPFSRVAHLFQARPW